MIKGIYGGGRYVQVNNGSPAWPSIYSNHNSTPSSSSQSFSGQLRYNTMNSSMEIFDGNMWQAIGNSVSQVGLTHEAEELLDWVKQKRQEEINLMKRMEQHPGLKDAYERFKVMDALTLEEEKHQGVYRRA